MLNKVSLIGSLGQSPESRQLSNGTTVVNFSIATTEKWKDKDGVSQSSTEWHNIVIFDKLADVAAKYLKKGSKVYVEGKLKTDKWEKEGHKFSATKIVVNELKMLDSKPVEGQTVEAVQQTEESTIIPDNKMEMDLPF